MKKNGQACGLCEKLKQQKAAKPENQTKREENPKYLFVSLFLNLVQSS